MTSCVLPLSGVNYWCDYAKVKGQYLGDYASEQISRGGELKLHDIEADTWCNLDRDMLLEGIRLAIEDRYFANYRWYGVGCENGLDCCEIDAEVADGIIQYALFEEIIYG